MPKTKTEPRLPGEWAAEGDPYDCTTEVCQQGGPTNPKGRWPMYSYERPAYLLWNAIAAALHKRGWSDDKIKAWLQSRLPRKALDGSLGDSLERLGKRFAKTIADDDVDWL